MKTQISRWSDEPRRRRSGLYQQQGRMVSDADWNELTELLKRRVDEALGEVVGSGAPRLDTTGLLMSGPAGGVPLVKRASVYVDGIRATLESPAAGTAPFPITQQADFPGAPAFTATDQMIYLDVWELATTALEDGSLLDPGLHGADTATRTQTLAQIKWCPGTLNPLTDPKNPTKGDGLCELELREGSSGADPCDACAAEVALEQRIGNYLFRLEVHEVLGPANAPTEIRLKWSAENAAEHFLQAEAPPEFKRNDYIYEFYNNTTERQLGAHLAAGFTPARALLRTQGWPGAADLPDPAIFPFVRRWDGHATLVKIGNAWTVKSEAGVLLAKDKGRVFEAPALTAVPTHGNFVYNAPRLALYLSGLKLTLTLDGKKFVAGDYWLATVREGAEPTARVQPASATPLGVMHHYMLLGRATGPTLQVLSDAELRRQGFPRLTDLTADRVGYSPESQATRWTTLINDPNIPVPPNVQRALDLLVERGGGDLGFVAQNAITVARDNVAKKITIGESHSALINNPHDTTAAQVGALALQNYSFTNCQFATVTFTQLDGSGAARTVTTVAPVSNTPFRAKFVWVTGSYSANLQSRQHGGSVSAFADVRTSTIRQSGIFAVLSLEEGDPVRHDVSISESSLCDVLFETSDVGGSQQTGAQVFISSVTATTLVFSLSRSNSSTLEPTGAFQLRLRAMIFG